MKQATLLSALAAFSSMPSPTSAGVIDMSILKRQTASDYAALIKPILEWFGVAFPEAYKTWDYSSEGNMCAVAMSTKDGGNCHASVACNDGVETPYDAWNVCYVGGRQYFNDPRIGDFSITFSQKDGEGEGLTNPILSLANVDNWKEFDVANLAGYYQRANIDCNKGITPLNCDNTGPFICAYTTGNSYIYDTKDKSWICGMPKTGLGGGGIDSNGPTNDAGYAPGWCGAHVTQYQKPDPSIDPYSLDIKVFDANENEIGNSGGIQQSPSPVGVTSKLPNVLSVGTGAVDDDIVEFWYGDQYWGSNDQAHACNFGSYDGGKREGDCGFTC